MKPTSKVVAVMVTTALISAGIGLAAGLIIRSPAQVAADTAPPPRTDLTVPVESGAVTSPTLLPGLVTTGVIVELTPTGSGVITALPLGPGSPVSPGVVLAEVNDRPVILLSGSVPLLRDLRPTDRGPDVRRLQEALAPWGGTAGDGVWGSNTTDALNRLYKETGYSPPKDAMALSSELVFAPTAAATILSISGGVGKSFATPLIRATISPPVVSAEVADVKASSLTVGQKVAVNGSAIGGATTGTIASIGGLARGQDGVARSSVVVRPDRELPLSAVESRAEITVVNSTNSPTGLVVPLAAIRATADGGNEVLVRRDDLWRHCAVVVEETGSGRARVRALSNDLAVGEAVLVGQK